jgi:hypothetical protein
MCYVQITGLMLATVVTLGIVPVVYVTFVENLKLIRWEPERHAVPIPSVNQPGQAASDRAKV